MCIIQGQIIENKNTAWREACKLLAMRCFCLLKDHEKGSGRDKQDSDQFFDGDLLMQEKKSQDDGEHDAELVYGHHLGGFPHLQRLVIADPGGTGSKAGKNQENPAFPADIGKTALGVGHEYLTAVARLELTPSIPTFASMEVRAAKTDERRANKNHMDEIPPLKCFRPHPQLHKMRRP